MEIENITPISPQLVKELREAPIFSMENLLSLKEYEGVEQLGFIKGVYYVLQVLQNISVMQQADIEDREIGF